jgi:hypothetical protein
MNLSSVGLRAAAAVLCLLFSAGCVRQATRQPEPPTAQLPPAPTHLPRQLMVYAPQTDEAAARAIGLFDRHPKLRMVLALSPRLKKFSADPAMKARVLQLHKDGRLEFGLQLPNAPLLPLIVDTNSAKDAVPAGATLPNPPFAHPDDVIHLIARSKADFFHVWRVLPRGLVLPYGAASSSLFAVLDKLGFAWVVAALEAPPVDGPYKAGSFVVWDATPQKVDAGTRVQLWEERTMRDRKDLAPAGWIAELEKGTNEAILPSDLKITAQPLPADNAWKRRSWTTRDWSTWIGNPKKNAAWTWLRRTREALEVYKDSGQASVKHLDLAFEEMYTAENATYLAAIGSDTLPATQSEEREHELQASLHAVFRLMGQNPPDDLFAEPMTAGGTAAARVASTARGEILPDGTEHVLIEDPAGDERGDGRLPEPAGARPGTFDIRSFQVWAGSDSLRFSITLSSPLPSGLGRPGNSGPFFDVYIDQNHQPNIGTLSFMPKRRLQAAVTDAWEYAMTLTGSHVRVYRTSGSGTYDFAVAASLTVTGDTLVWSLPKIALRGSPRRWSYQVLSMTFDPASTEAEAMPVASGSAPPIYDLLDPSRMTQAALLTDVASGRRNDLPFIRPRAE